MKKKLLILSILFQISFFAMAQKNTISTAIKNNNGVIELQINDAVRNLKIVSEDKSANTKKGNISKASHQAILNSDGTQEIHLTDKTGKTYIIKEKKGENIQLTYLNFLKKENLDCGCDAESDVDESISKTAIRQ